MSNNDIRNEIRDAFYNKERLLKSPSRTLYVVPLGMGEHVKAIRQASNYNEIKSAVSQFISIGSECKISTDRLFGIVISNVSGIESDKLADICIDAVMSRYETTPPNTEEATVNKPVDGINNQIATDNKKVVEQPIVAKNMGFDPSAFIRQPQPQQPNMAMGQMYNPTTFITMPQGATNMQMGNTPHGNTCQCPECKGSPYWNNMNDSDKINFIKQHYELLDIHKRNVSSDEVNALINLIKNPDTINRLIKLGYTGNGSSLRLREVPPAKYNEYGKGIFNRYYEVPVGNNNIVICYNTKGELNADGYMMYTLQVKRDSELK